MRFKRYAALLKEVNRVTVFASSVMFFAGVYDVLHGKYEMLLVAFATAIVSTLLWYTLTAVIAQEQGGALKDEIVMDETQAELYAKSGNIVILWEDVIFFRSVVPYYGIRETIIIDKYGKRISFTSSNRLDKQIFALRPELKRVFEKRFTNEESY